MPTTNPQPARKPQTCPSRLPPVDVGAARLGYSAASAADDVALQYATAPATSKPDEQRVAGGARRRPDRREHAGADHRAQADHTASPVPSLRASRVGGDVWRSPASCGGVSRRPDVGKVRAAAVAEILYRVTLEEALVELGVEAGADPETVRRAYLRVIKVRKPESDPDGFKRAREAYEIARDEGQLEALVHRFAGAGTGAGTGTVAVPAGDAKPAPGGSGEDAESRDDIIFQGFMAAWQSIPRSDNPRKRLEIAREAVATLPRDRRAYWMVVQSLTRFVPDSELAEALRAGYYAGFPEFLEALLVRTPRLVTREEVDAALASATLSLRMAGAAAGAAWDPDRTAALVVEMCAKAQANAQASDPEALPIAEMLDVILALQQANAVVQAARAQQAVRDLLRDNGLELPLMRGPLGGVWTLAEELATLPAAFPRALREAFAIATRAGDLKPAFFDTCAIIDRDRDEVERWAAKLTGATNVANTMREALQWRAAQRRSEWRFRVSPVMYWVAVPVLLALIRNCGSGPTSYVPSTYEPARTRVPHDDRSTRGRGTVVRAQRRAGRHGPQARRRAVRQRLATDGTAAVRSISRSSLGRSTQGTVSAASACWARSRTCPAARPTTRPTC